MRITEIREGIELQNDKGQKVGSSVSAAKQAITSVTFSRVLMASPGMSTYIIRICFTLTHHKTDLFNSLTIWSCKLDPHANKMKTNVTQAASISLLFSELGGISIMILITFSVLTPLLMNYLDKRNLLRRIPWAAGPIQVALCGVCLTFATPLCCALFAQRVAVPVAELEPEVQEQIRSKDPQAKVVYYNKGL